MRESKFTQGPWAAGSTRFQRDFRVFVNVTAGKDNFVACVSADPMHYEAIAANARLIAAAPDLLFELRKLSRAYANLLEIGRDRIIGFGGTCDLVSVMEEGDPDLRSARTAIAKATGGDQ